MSGSTAGGIVGGAIGFVYGGPSGARWGFMIGSTLGGIIDPEKIYGPRLSDASQQTAQEGVKIPFGYGTFAAPGHVIAVSDLTEHERKEGGKGGPQQISYYYTRSFALGICEGPATVIQVKRNGKLVYDISPTSTILGKNAKFLKNHTIYEGNETQTNDPTLEAVYGAANVVPFRGLCYIVGEDVEFENAGALDQYEFVVQNCGTVTNLADTRGAFLAGLNSGGDIGVATRTGTWTNYLNVVPSGAQLERVAAMGNYGTGIDTTGADPVFYYTADRGATWALSTGPTAVDRDWRAVCDGPGKFVAVGVGLGADAGKSYLAQTRDFGANWTESEITGIVGAEGIKYGGGNYVLTTDHFGSGTQSGIFSSTTLASWTRRSAEENVQYLHYNGTDWLAVGDNCRTIHGTADATTWTFKSQIGTGVFNFQALTGGPGYFIAGATAGQGIFRTTDNGATWTDVSAATGTATGAATMLGTTLVGFNTSAQFSDDAGLTWLDHPAFGPIYDVAAFGPIGTWFTVPDADGLYADEDGNLITDYLEDASEASECSVTLGDIVEDLCLRVGIDASEIDVSELTDEVRGYRCATESSAAAYIEPLTQGFFFDRSEWDKKLRFPKRGGSSVASLTMDDLTLRDGPAIEQEQAQEVELLRKVNVMTINPAADYSAAKSTWERRTSTVVATGESTVEIPITVPTDTGAQIAEKRGKVAWSETDKFKFGLSMKWSKLTPTDVVTLTDRPGRVHRIRLASMFEESGLFEVEEAVKDRASTYVSTATGITNPNRPPVVDTVAGPSLLSVMNLPPTAENPSGAWVGVAGVLAGWPGAQLLISYDGGASYLVAKTITEPTVMGFLTDDPTSAVELAVHVYGGQLESKTEAQVAAGGNYSVVTTDGVSEILAYEDATETAPTYYDLDGMPRGLLGTAIADHFTGDSFVDLATAYFIPIDQVYAGQTLYFKAVSIGISPDAIDPVAFVFEGSEYVEDGGEIT